ncbi:MAG TPA: methyl-accepting chemotaxis protein [Syntrophomonadaceae bacterium]|nr:methyl-accepting chemotaxis protein [Syntrophomonadaceae bacterium]
MLVAIACFCLGFVAGIGFVLLYRRKKHEMGKEDTSGEEPGAPGRPDVATEEDVIKVNPAEAREFFTTFRDALSLVESVIGEAHREAGEAGERWAAAVGEMVERANAGLRRLQKTIGELASGQETGSAGLVDEARRTARALVDSSRSAVAEFIASGDSYLEMMQGIQADRFRSIAERIRGILRQTNLVAINAEIEAAHLGEMGCGLGVIAGEVMKLSGMIGDSVKAIDETAGMVEEKLRQFASEISAKAENAAHLCEDSDRLLGEYLAQLEVRTGDIVAGLKGSGEEIDSILESLGKIVDALQFQDISYQKIRNALSILQDVRSELDGVLDNLNKGGMKAVDRRLFEGFKRKYTMRAERLHHELTTGQKCLDERRVGRVYEELGENVELF